MPLAVQSPVSSTPVVSVGPLVPSTGSLIQPVDRGRGPRSSSHALLRGEGRENGGLGDDPTIEASLSKRPGKPSSPEPSTPAGGNHQVLCRLRRRPTRASWQRAWVRAEGVKIRSLEKSRAHRPHQRTGQRPLVETRGSGRPVDLRPWASGRKVPTGHDRGAVRGADPETKASPGGRGDRVETADSVRNRVYSEVGVSSWGHQSHRGVDSGERLVRER